MIITRSPLRISLGGGGTDFPSYYNEREGFLLAAAIDKYVYVSITKPFSEGIYLKYSEHEQVSELKDIKHNIIRETLGIKDFASNQIEITTLADIPSGTGLGSSGSFTTALIKGLHLFNREPIHQDELAELACHIEMDLLSEPIGKQDQYISAYGGLTSFTFMKGGKVTVESLKVSADVLAELEENLLLFFTGFTRPAGSILIDQKVRSEKKEELMMRNLDKVKKMGYESKKLIIDGDIVSFGQLMHEHWQTKKQRSGNISNKNINDWYEIGLQNGAIGGKLVGAGGGGFLMFVANDKIKLRKAMIEAGLSEVRFNFDFEGTKALSI